MKYNVGDRVLIKSLDWYKENKDEDGDVIFEDYDFLSAMVVFCGKILTISVVFGDGTYLMKEDNDGFVFTNEMIEELVEDKALKQYEVPTGSIKIWDLPNGYIFKDENGNVINATKIVLEKKKKEYPKTYEECCRIVNANPCIRLVYNLSDGQKYYHDEDNLYLYENFRRLKICRDAYWKIAGEEMGLDKPWKPDWLDDDTKKCVITSTNVFETFGGLGYVNFILTFPTEEMRDAFYENFKELIESCKELL